MQTSAGVDRSSSGGMELLKQPSREMCEWIVSKRVNEAGESDDDPTTIEPFNGHLF